MPVRSLMMFQMLVIGLKRQMTSAMQCMLAGSPGAKPAKLLSSCFKNASFSIITTWIHVLESTYVYEHGIISALIVATKSSTSSLRFARLILLKHSASMRDFSPI